MSGILIVAEHEGGSFKKSATELLGKATQLAAALGTSVSAVVLGDAPAADLGKYGATTVYQVGGDFSSYDPAAMTDALAAAIAQAQPDVVLAPASYAGKDAIPRLAARLDTGMATECTDLRAEGGAVVGRRPLFAGKLYGDVKISGKPAIFTVRANSFSQPAAGGGAASVVAVAAEAKALTKVLERKAPSSTVADLTEADRIVSGGRSLKTAGDFDAVIRPLAASIGATVGASRAAVDAGMAHHNEQVGQTGKTVNPTLYIAMGISGAIQHLAGMRTSKVIVAVNKDPEAPIFEHATYGLVADLFEVAPKLQAAFEKALS
ncbi:MAG: electron transfer flavoprotein subunit alpha/FixB family protein [Alphaproteobacteria bacterium]|nr:electron transfer flavoprotein subunit alpha/FixB family protein [Alphaproteobacteria bacterium]